MSNKKVLSSTDCDCGCSGSGLTLQPGGSSSFLDSFTVRHRHGIAIGNVINQYNENGKKIYELDDLNLQLPAITFGNDAPSLSEIGQTIALVTFNGLITQGTYPIVSRTITPNPGGLDLTAAFNFQKTDVKRTTPGTAESHMVQAVDDQGNSRSVSSGVIFKHAFYQGYSGLTSLDETAIKALVNKSLNDSIIQQYGGQKTYVVPIAPATPKYIYWCGPVGTATIVGAILNGLTLPLLDLAPVNVTNIHDGAIVTSYWVKRTANLFDPTTYLITLS